MTTEELAQIGAILHRGRFHVQSMTPWMAKSFMEELAEIGFVIVPKEPTEAMINAGADTLTDWDMEDGGNRCECNEGRVWQAMLKAV